MKLTPRLYHTNPLEEPSLRISSPTLGSSTALFNTQKYGENYMKTNRNQSSVVWVFDRAQFCFDDSKFYERWKGHQKIEFELNLANSDDYGEALIEGPEYPTSCFYEVTPDIADIDIELSEYGPVISGEIDVLMAFKDGLTEEELSTWHDEYGGCAVATISIGDHAAWATDRGSYFRLVRDPIIPNPISTTNNIPF